MPSCYQSAPQAQVPPCAACHHMLYLACASQTACPPALIFRHEGRLSRLHLKSCGRRQGLHACMNMKCDACAGSDESSTLVFGWSEAQVAGSHAFPLLSHADLGHRLPLASSPPALHIMPLSSGLTAELLNDIQVDFPILLLSGCSVAQGHKTASECPAASPFGPQSQSAAPMWSSDR